MKTRSNFFSKKNEIILKGMTFVFQIKCLLNMSCVTLMKTEIQGIARMQENTSYETSRLNCFMQDC